MTINIHDAKTHFSRLVARAEAGETIVIGRGGKPVARLVPFDGAGTPATPRIGFMDGELSVPDDFDRWSSDEITGLFEGRA